MATGLNDDLKSNLVKGNNAFWHFHELLEDRRLKRDTDVQGLDQKWLGQSAQTFKDSWNQIFFHMQQHSKDSVTMSQQLMGLHNDIVDAENRTEKIKAAFGNSVTTFVRTVKLELPGTTTGAENGSYDWETFVFAFEKGYQDQANGIGQDLVNSDANIGMTFDDISYHQTSMPRLDANLANLSSGDLPGSPVPTSNNLSTSPPPNNGSSPPPPNNGSSPPPPPNPGLGASPPPPNLGSTALPSPNPGLGAPPPPPPDLGLGAPPPPPPNLVPGGPPPPPPDTGLGASPPPPPNLVPGGPPPPPPTTVPGGPPPPPTTVPAPGGVLPPIPTLDMGALKSNPEGQEALKTQQDNNIQIVNGKPGQGSSYDPKTDTLTLDPTDPDQNGTFVEKMAEIDYLHKHQHDPNLQPQTAHSRQDYINAQLDKEAYAHAKEFEYDQAIGKQTGSTLQTTFQQGVDTFKQTHPQATQAQLNAAGEKAIRDAIAKTPVDGSTTGQTYEQLYGNTFDSQGPSGLSGPAGSSGQSILELMAKGKL